MMGDSESTLGGPPGDRHRNWVSPVILIERFILQIAARAALMNRNCPTFKLDRSGDAVCAFIGRTFCAIHPRVLLKTRSHRPTSYGSLLV
jgi:hypothetical protein